MPQVYLRNISSDNKKDRFYFYDKINDKMGTVNISNVAQEKEFYTDVSQVNKDFFEQFYSIKVEPILGKLLNRIISTATLFSETTPLLTKPDRSALSRMVAFQMLRTRSTRNFIHEKSDQVLRPFVSKLSSIPEFRSNKGIEALIDRVSIMDDNTLKELSLPITIDENRISQFASLIDSMVCTFYYNLTDEPFITSDNPIVVKRLSTDDIGLGKAGLSWLDTMIFYPISPRLLAVFMHNDFLFTSGFKEYENRKCAIKQKEIIWTVNRFQHLLASRQVYSSKPFFV